MVTLKLMNEWPFKSALFKRKRKVCVEHKNRNTFFGRRLDQQLWETTVNMTGNSGLVLFMIIWSYTSPATVRMMRALFHYTMGTEERERTISLFLYQEIEILQNMISEHWKKRALAYEYQYSSIESKNHISILGNNRCKCHFVFKLYCAE